MGLGTSVGIKKEMTRTEGFEGNEVVDEESCNLAQEVADSNKIEKNGTRNTGYGNVR